MSVAAPARAGSLELVRFLLTRIDEDEVELKRLARHEADAVEVPGGVRGIARLQAEAHAKRRVIGTLQQLLVLRDQPFEKAIREQAAHMLRVLAVPYESHAQYREEWRPAGPH